MSRFSWKFYSFFSLFLASEQQEQNCKWKGNNRPANQSVNRNLRYFRRRKNIRLVTWNQKRANKNQSGRKSGLKYLAYKIRFRRKTAVTDIRKHLTMHADTRPAYQCTCDGKILQYGSGVSHTTDTRCHFKNPNKQIFHGLSLKKRKQFADCCWNWRY